MMKMKKTKSKIKSRKEKKIPMTTKKKMMSKNQKRIKTDLNSSLLRNPLRSH